MKSRRSGLLLAVAALLFAAACGEDNNIEIPRLTGAISATATALGVTNGAIFPTGGGVIQIDAERIVYASKEGNTLRGLIRGTQGTTPAAHEAGAFVRFVSGGVPQTPTGPAAAPTSTVVAGTLTPTTVPFSPTHTATQKPSETPTPTETSAPAATPSATLAPNQVRISIGHASGAPGSTVQVAVSLQTDGQVVAGTQNDIVFDPRLVGLAKASDCVINPEISDRAEGCEEDPPVGPCKQIQRNLADCPGAAGCPPGSEGLKRFRGLILATGNINPIPGGVLYTCTFTVTGDVAATAVLQNLTAGASSPAGAPIDVLAEHGSITILGPTPTGPGEATATPTIPERPTFTPEPTPERSPTPTKTAALPTLTPTATHTPGAAVCGNGIIEGGEICDDGNLAGGDGCAANCTTEVGADCLFGCVETVNGDEVCSGATVKTSLFSIPLTFDGSQTLTSGRPRNEPVTTTNSEVRFEPNEIPLALKAPDLRVEPVSVPGLVCACVRGEVTGDFGPGNAGGGRVGCGDGGLDEVDYLFKIDHNVTPGSPGNGGGLPDDPGCVNGELEDGSQLHPHAGVCNSIGFPEFTGGGPRGSAVIVSTTSISLIQDAGTCQYECDIEQKGPDCLPCTDDDLIHEDPTRMATTTGTARAILYDANNRAGKTIETSVTGAPVNCDAMLADPDHPDLTGSGLVSAWSAVDSAMIGDNTTTAVFACVAP